MALQTKLLTPILIATQTGINTVEFSWQEITGAVGYYVTTSLNGATPLEAEIPDPTITGISYTFASPGTLAITVFAEAEPDGDFTNSDVASITYTATKLATPTWLTPNESETSTTLRFSVLDNDYVDRYEISIDYGGETYETSITATSATEYSYTFSQIGLIKYSVYAKSSVTNFNSDTATAQSTLATPVFNTTTRTTANQIELSWDAVPYASDYELYVHDYTTDDYEFEETTYIVTGTSQSIAIDSPGIIEYTLKAYDSTAEFYSETTGTQTYTLAKLDTPVLNDLEMLSINSIRISWEEVPYATGYEFGYYIAGATEKEEYTYISTTNEYMDYTFDSAYEIGYAVRATYSDTDFNSDYTLALNYTAYELNTPSLLKTEITSTVEDGSGVTAVTLSWTSIANANGYIIKDTLISTDTSGTTTTYIYNFGGDGTVDYNSVTINAGDLAYGNHTFKVMATVDSYSTFSTEDLANLDSDTKLNTFDSDFSNEEILEISLLDAPVISWLSDTTSLLADQSTVVHDLITNADYYTLEIYDQNNLTTYFKTITLSEDNTSINIASVFDTFVLTADYNILVRAKSYDTLYYTYSTASNILEYKTIQLDAPTDLIWDSNTGTLSWTYPTFDASSYGLSGTLYFEVYTLEDDSSLTLVETTTAKQITKSLAAGLYKFVVKAYFTAESII